MVLVGNKCDIPEREVTKEDGEKLGEEFKCDYIESSAKENIGISDVFTKVVKAIRASEVTDNGGKPKKKKSCFSH